MRESVSHLTDLNRKCDRLRRKDRKFLIDLIETTKRDNVPLTEEQCLKFCEKHRVKNQECDELCSPKVVRCSHWPDSSKCLSLHQENSKYNAKNSLVSDYYEEIPSEQDGGPGSASGFTSAAAAPIPFPLEVKIKSNLNLNDIMENVLYLERQVGAFQGEKEDKEYKFLNEMLTRNFLALDGIETAGRDDVRQQRKESVNSLNGFVCFNRLNKMKSLLKDSPVISFEALENQNHQQSKLSHQLEHDGSPDPASGPTSAATAQIPVPVEVKIKLRPDDPCFSKLNKIMENILDLEKQIGAFQGEKHNKEYKFLDEMLTRNLLALDGIEPM